VQTANPTEELEVTGKTKTDSLQVVGGASDGAILISDATGNASWIMPEMAIYRDFKVDVIHGGAATTNTWHTRTLNNTQYQSGSSISRIGNVITLQQGTYYITASAPGYQVQMHQLVLRDQSNNVALHGTIQYSTNTTSVQDRSFIEGVVVVATASMNFTLDHFTQFGVVNVGLGLATGGGVKGTDNVFTTITIKKIK